MPARSDAVVFDGQVVLVTGAGRGIGRCHANLFAERGAHVVVNDVDADVAHRVVDDIVAAGGDASAAVGDVVDDASSIVRAALGVDGHLDVLVNNAGIALAAPFGIGTASEVSRLVNVHAAGTAAMTALAWDALIASRGRVVNTTSNAVVGLANSTAYAAAKGAVLGLTRSLAIEAAAVGVRVNAVMPMARTRMYEIAGGDVGSEQDAMMTAYFRPEQISPVVAFLASSSVPFNGEVVEVSAGTAAFVHFAVTPFVSTMTPEAARDGLTASAAAPVTVVNSLEEMLASKFAMLASNPIPVAVDE